MFKNKFIIYYFNVLSEMSLFKHLNSTKENSPYHREESIKIHTDMCVAQYLSNSPHEWHKVNYVLGAFAIAFHDVGKPMAMEEKFKEERGHYLTFNGHETLSARLWENFYCDNQEFLEKEFQIDKYAAFKIGWMIQNHISFKCKPKKLEEIKYTIGAMHLGDIFPLVLLSDNVGRISDNMEEKMVKLQHWLTEFDNIEYEYPPLCDGPKLFMLIGPSGSGKSTFTKEFPNSNVYSWDTLRLEFYDDTSIIDPKEKYKIAFEKSCVDKEFMQKALQRFNDLIHIGKDIIVDNINLSKRRRRALVTEAKRHGYKIVGVLFPLSLRELEERNKYRDDKDTMHIFRNQYFGLSLPSYFEVDELIIKR